MNISVILPAAGTGSRTKLGFNKVLYEYNDNYLINHTINKFLKIKEVKEIIVVYNKNDKDFLDQIILKHKKVKVVEGSQTRQKSVFNGFKKVSNTTDYIFVHDTARPNISKKLIKNIIEQLNSNKDCYCVGLKVVDSLRNIDNDNQISGFVDRNNIVRMQTPQIAKYEVFKQCVKNTTKDYTDEAGMFLENGFKIEFIKGEEENYKVTTEDDIRRINELV